MLAKPITSIALFSLALAGCDNKANDAGKVAKSSNVAGADNDANKIASKTVASEPKAAKQKTVVPKLTEYDLSSVGTDWEGLVVTAPDGCKVMGDGSKDARVACKGPGIGSKGNGFDLIFSMKKLGALKTRRQELWKTWSEGKANPDKWEVLEDTPELFTWKRVTEYGESFHVIKQMKVGDKTISCHTNFRIGGGHEDEHKAHLAGCATLKAKS